MSVDGVPFFVPDIGEAEIASVVDTLRSGWLTTGPKTLQFEREFAQRVGARHAVAVNSATAALHLALDALGVTRGDEVIVPTMTFTATAEVVVHLGARPVLVDCLSKTLTIDPEAVEAAITPQTKAIIPMHYAGQPCRMDRIGEIASAHRLAVVEDAAHALPAAFQGRVIGSISDVTCFSFYANKTITTGEGGMLCTDNDELADRARMRSLHGMSRDAWKRFTSAGSWYYEVVYPGYKYNMSDIMAALGLVQLGRCDEFYALRRERAAQYQQLLADVPEVAMLHSETDVDHAWHLLVILLDLDRLTTGRNAFIDRLKEANIGIGVHYVPLHMHPYYRDTFGYAPDDFPAARRAYERMITLPLFPRMSREQVQYVVNTVRDVAGAARR